MTDCILKETLFFPADNAVHCCSNAGCRSMEGTVSIGGLSRATELWTSGVDVRGWEHSSHLSPLWDKGKMETWRKSASSFCLVSLIFSLAARSWFLLSHWVCEGECSANMCREGIEMIRWSKNQATINKVLPKKIKRMFLKVRSIPVVWKHWFTSIKSGWSSCRTHPFKSSCL